MTWSLPTVIVLPDTEVKKKKDNIASNGFKSFVI
jgi:hypothetical protein